MSLLDEFLADKSQLQKDVIEGNISSFNKSNPLEITIKPKR